VGVNGVDLSNQNGGVNLASVSPAPSFLIAKASEALSFTDSTYPAYAAKAFDMGIPFGAYHFFHAENKQARGEAHNFMVSARPRSLLSLWVDYETYGESGQADAEEIGFFIDEVKLNFPRAKVGIYCNETGYNRLHPYFAEIPFQGLWYANPSIPMTAQGDNGIFWQVHQYATVGGIDRDYWDWDTGKIWQYYQW
jgi:GH25 family lysozyme M1 (1,4-beta-N-acetylmuramidase)